MRHLTNSSFFFPQIKPVAIALNSLFLLCLITQTVSSQTLKRQSIGTAGGTNFGEGYHIKQTVGQSSNTERFSGDNTALRQGFQQPSDVSGKIKKCDACNLSVFPNPVETTAQLSVPLQSPTYSYGIYDLSGKMIYNAENQNSITQNISNQGLAAGQYLVKVIYSGGCFCDKKIIVK